MPSEWARLPLARPRPEPGRPTDRERVQTELVAKAPDLARPVPGADQERPEVLGVVVRLVIIDALGRAEAQAERRELEPPLAAPARHVEEARTTGGEHSLELAKCGKGLVEMLDDREAEHHVEARIGDARERSGQPALDRGDAWIRFQVGCERDVDQRGARDAGEQRACDPRVETAAEVAETGVVEAADLPVHTSGREPDAEPIDEREPLQLSVGGRCTGGCCCSRLGLLHRVERAWVCHSADTTPSGAHRYIDERVTVPGSMTIVACPGCSCTESRTVRRAVFGTSDLERCVRCGSEYLQPQPSDARLAEIYGVDYYSAWTAETDHVVQRMKSATFASIVELCDLERSAALLDVGCADGTLLRLAADAGARPFGIDLNERATERARVRVPDARLHCGELTDRPFGDTVFDAVTMVDFIEHVRDPAAHLAAARDVMADGGRLVISTPRVDSMLRRLFGARWPQYREEHLTYFSLAGLRSLLERAGFAVDSVRRTRKTLTLAYAYGQAVAFPRSAMSGVVKLGYRILPFARHRSIRVYLGEMTVVATRPRH